MDTDMWDELEQHWCRLGMTPAEVDDVLDRVTSMTDAERHAAHAIIDGWERHGWPVWPPISEEPGA